MWSDTRQSYRGPGQRMSARRELARCSYVSRRLPKFARVVHDGTAATTRKVVKALRIGDSFQCDLIAFGVVIVLAINGHSTVTDSLKDEKIVGSADMNPPHRGSDDRRSQRRRRPELRRCREEIDTGSEARCFAMRIHALEASGGPDLRRDGALRDRERRRQGYERRNKQRRRRDSQSRTRPQSLGDRNSARRHSTSAYGRATVAVQPCRRNRSASGRGRLHRAAYAAMRPPPKQPPPTAPSASSVSMLGCGVLVFAVGVTVAGRLLRGSRRCLSVCSMGRSGGWERVVRWVRRRDFLSRICWHASHRRCRSTPWSSRLLAPRARPRAHRPDDVRGRRRLRRRRIDHIDRRRALRDQVDVRCRAASACMRRTVDA